MFSLIQAASDFVDKPGFNWKLLITGFTISSFLFESYLTHRQIKSIRSNGKVIPKQLESKIDEKTAIKSQDYSLTKLRFSQITKLVSLAENLAFIRFDVLPKLWASSASFLAKLTFLPPILTGVIPQSLVFLTQMGFISTILGLPIAYYSNFVIEEKYGFNKLTIKLWITDMIKEALVSIVIGFPVMSIFLKIIDYFGDSFMFYVSIFLFVFQIFMIIVYPKFIQPLFNKLEPLQEGELKTEIEKLASKNKFPLDKLFVIDGSARSSHSNAYFMGLPWGSKQIVLFDTLIETSTVPETIAVLGHEIGHWALSHTTKTLITGQFHIFTMFTMFAAFVKNKSLFQSFGFANETPIIVGFLLFNDILKPVDAVLSFVLNLVSRKHEYEADKYAVDQGYATELKTALITLHKENLSSLSTDWLFSSYHHSHPHLTERLEAIDVASESFKKE
ncbi:unnamed protein product [Kuraishia capsulata CBS 1993]|uniref:CAAX prenyl protease n=1 Tax=Kuraishia capsulata CBS 1993 TaxID=1382522 RepID=W6MHE3_9ASCO|nr:uncharacterized protein KUCA_T00001360001 [Kuraishia capsulata CBS 1993]CDK25391.1 unnamed protein product [Kuraishia capsulata CBS 1993]